MRGMILGFDGVLVDDLPVHLEMLSRVLGDEGLEVTADQVAGYTKEADTALDADRRALRGAFRAHGQEVDPARLSRLVARKTAFYQVHLRREGYRALEGGRELAARAHQVGWMLGLVTATPRDEVEVALEQLEMSAYFKTLVTGTEESAAGVEPAAHRRAWRELNAQPPLPSRLLHPHEVLAIDAWPPALAAAAAAGLVTVGVTSRFAAAMLKDAEHVIRDLGELEVEDLPRQKVAGDS